MVAFDVDAMDDVGIDRIEIYDGDELVATVTESPYVTEILVSSADNGSHAYSAVVFDTVGQSAESEVVLLSVNVTGGAILELREDIGEAYMPLTIGYPRVVVSDTDDVFVTLTTPPDALERTQVRALGYSSTLSLLWESTLNPFGSSVWAMAHPIVTTNGQLWVGGMLVSADDDFMGLYMADTTTGDPLPHALFGNTNGDFVFPVTAQLPLGDIVLATENNVLESRSPDLMSTSWSEEQFPTLATVTYTDFGMIGVDVDGAGNILLTFVAHDSECGIDEFACIRKLTPEGTTLWTRPAASASSNISFSHARFDSSGRAVTMFAGASQGFLADIYDPNGKLVESFQAFAGEYLSADDLAIDPQGNLLVVGHDYGGDTDQPWAMRISSTGDVLWSRTYDGFGAGEIGSHAGGVAVSDDGRAYMVGVSNLDVPGDFAYQGTAWIAEIGL